MTEVSGTCSASSTQEQQKHHNLVKMCLEKDLERENFAKFQQVLEYVHDQCLDVILYDLYNGQLTSCLTAMQKAPLPEGYSFSHWVQYKIKFYSFRFMGNIGRALVDRVNIGADRAEQFFLNLTKVLFFHALTTKSYTANLALVELEQLCSNRKITLQSLYHNHRSKFLRLIIKAILQKLNDGIKDQTNGVRTNGNGLTHENGSGNPPNKSNCVITYMTRALDVFSVTSITSEDVAQSLIIITNLIQKETYNDAIKLFLDSLASYQNIDIYTLVRSHIQAIMVSILLRRKLSHFDLTASLMKLSSFCDNKTPKELLETKFTFIKGRLLLNYSIDPKCVTEAIYYLSKFEKEEHDRPFEDEFEEEKNFIDYLNPSIIGILLGMDAHFTTTKHDLGSEGGIKQIESLCRLISMLDENQVQTIHVKLLSTLSLLLNLRPRRDNMALNISLKTAWALFVSKLKPDLKTALVLNICVSLYDLLEDIPEAVAPIYEDLICRDEPSLQAELKSLFFIPDIPCLKQVYSHLTPYVRRDDSVTTLQDLQLSLECTLPLMKYENQKCRLIAIAKTKQLLQVNQKLLTSKLLVNLDEPVESMLSKTIQSLLAASSTQDAECSALIAECLGILGAINPIRLDHLIFGDMPGRVHTMIYNLRSAEFVIFLIESLTSSLFSDQRSESETASYALQVVVKNYGVFRQAAVKERLSREAMRACELCQNTSYSGNKTAVADLSTSIYEKFKSTNQYSYKEWLDKFSLNLTATVTERKFQEVFHACSYVYKYNEKLAEILIPIAMIYIILHQPSHVQVIQREMMAILEEDVGVSTQDLDTVYSEAERGNLQTLHFQCANMIFCAMDAIYRLYSNLKLQRLKLASQQSGYIKSFLDSIPKDRLAILASKCRSHTRALCYFEQHLFSNKAQLDKYATALQRIYVALDDTFEASGVDMVRTSPTTLTDDIAKYEACGKFNKAVTCCLTSLDIMQSTDTEEPVLEDTLRCLSNQGDYRRLHEISWHMLKDYPQCKRGILPYAMEASWKLGKWDELDYSFKNEQFEPLLESASVGQGYLLRSLLDPSQNVPQNLKIVRHKLMKPLSIAMMDRSAYFRGYQNLSILHTIGDFDLTYRFIADNRPTMLKMDENSADTIRESILKEYADLTDIWAKRNRLVQPTLRSLEPLLVYQRALSLIMTQQFPILENRINIDIGKMWLTSADAAREARSFDRSFYCLTQAQRWFGSNFDRLALDLRVRYHIEQAKLEWDQGEQTKAIRGLKLSLERLKDHRIYQHLAERHMKKIATPVTTDVFPQLNKLKACEDCSYISEDDRRSFSDLKMLLTQYSEEAAAGIPETLLDMYEECVHLGVNREETYFRLARYYDKLLNYYMDNPQLCCEPIDDRHDADSTQRFSQNIRSGDREDVYTRLMEHSIIAFGNSLKYGVRYLRESMPRLLNIWYDLGQRKFTGAGKQNTQPTSRSVSTRIESTVRFITELKACIPPYYFMTAISLLLSRICHPHSGVAKKTSEIIELLLTTYPHQMIWQMISVLEDREDQALPRQKAAHDILKSIKNKKNLSHVETIIADTRKFALILNDICINNAPADKRVPDGLKKRLPPMANLSDVSEKAAKFKFDKIKVIAPVEASIRAILPMHNGKDSLDKHVVFPEHNVSYVREIESKVRVFNSMQQPRSIKLKLEDGRSVSIICKAGDDLRKDSRCIEFLNLLNRILRRDNQSNARFIEIQTFLVLALSSHTGLIELVPNCDSVKNILEPMYKQERNLTFINVMPKENRPDYHRTFVTEVLPKFSPPMLPQWFLRRFTEPTSWYMARLAFTRSTAVASMGGYIIGLGDRHLDNMLIDMGTGRVVHVDFNLLFHQGESLPTPEVVPFRLTHNLIASFGSLGTEGNFRKVCEITMRVMRKEKDALLTTLKPIIHDPCSEWIKARDYRDTKLARGSLDENKKAKSRIETTERKLKGYPRSKKFKPLTLIDSYSVDAQVENLIEEASDTQNLSKMYFGWCPYI